MSKEEINLIGDEIAGAKKYYLQRFVSTKILDSGLKEEANYSDEEFNEIISGLRDRIEFVGLR